MTLSWQKVTLTLKETFSISYGNYSHREALIVSLSYKNFVGYGECTSIDYYGINLEDLIQKLKRCKDAIETNSIVYPNEFYKMVLNLDLGSFLTSALDCAYWDLFGKLEGKSFLELNEIIVNSIPDSSITISVDSIENQIEKIQKSSWSKFKVKCNGFDKNSIEKLIEMPFDIALDSNGSYNESDCDWLQNQEFASKFTYLEQPMKPNQFSVLYRDKFANWMADEDCQSIENLRSLQSHYRSVNIKLMKCGGLTPALELIQEARKLDFKIMMGCMTESSIGISAGCALSPLADYCDLDGANLIANDIANGSKIINGKIEISDKPGLGIKIKN
ncbi:chloromuconate cycloisomerase [Flavobacterium amnicola]|uniref:Chloromuconate cycloisomerase n=1 Tax=Flavobacterium amnicola TaxID=2506422 RepID=A0A4Q1K206_9FLAO|nr:enolase C-terminal domain-like protein [Flavobacterium amnicola]RXR17323.1 chloromuconate cycloisomerase [Flavobacterium amnicola]